LATLHVAKRNKAIAVCGFERGFLHLPYFWWRVRKAHRSHNGMLPPSKPQRQATRTFWFVPKRGIPPRPDFNSCLSRKSLASGNITARPAPLASWTSGGYYGNNRPRPPILHRA